MLKVSWPSVAQSDHEASEGCCCRVKAASSPFLYKNS
jgi:hypothetical protein